jgi:tetratricopeptide (TPR) repeat protein
LDRRSLIGSSLSAQTPSASASLKKAEPAFNAGRYPEALTLFQRAQSESLNCGLGFYIGMTQYRLERLDVAIASFAASLACNPQLFLADRALGDAYLEKGDDNRALAAYEAAVKVQPDDPETLRTAAHLCLKHQLNQRAIPLLERLVQLLPGDPDAKADLGAAYGASEEMEKAVRMFRAALALNAQAPAAV